MNFGTEKLTPDEFRRALRQGRGAALMHVLTNGLEGVEDLVLKACLEEQAYDAQCEGHRAPWLYRMFKRAPEYELFRLRIIAELQNMSADSSAEQLCELACLMAHDGDNEARTALRSFVWAQNFKGGDSVFAVSGCHAIASIDGISALSEIARRYGRILLDDPTAFLDSLAELTDGADAYRQAFSQLTLLAKTDAAVAAYVEREQQEIDRRLANDQEGPAEKLARLERTRAEIQEQFPVDQVLTAAMRHERAKGKFFRFGRWSSDEALAIVLERLTVEPDIEACLRLLWVFRRAVPPYVPERLWVFATDNDVRIRDAALTALAHADDPAVGEFGRKYLARDTFAADDAAAIELFTKHYRPGDESLIMDVLNGLGPDETEAHDIGMSIRAFAKSNSSTSIACILNWLYRTNPCTICRGDAVRLLIEANSLPPAVAMECRFDASSEIQELVK
jgi:hypothetical protein